MSPSEHLAKRSLPPVVDTNADGAVVRELAQRVRVLRDRTITEVDKQGMGTTASVLLVANNRYDLSLFTVGERARLDEGLLHMYAASGWLPRNWIEREVERIEVDVPDGRVSAALDGEPVELEPPLRFEVLPRALRVLIPSHTNGGGGVHDNPEATDEEQELAQTGRQQEEEAMRGAGHEDPDAQRKRPEEDE